MKAVMRSYCVSVLLDTPPRPSFFALLCLRRRAKLVWLAPRVPFWAKWLGITVRPMPGSEEMLLWELERLPGTLEYKMLTLVPLSQKTARFVQNHREALEISYRLERKNP